MTCFTSATTSFGSPTALISLVALLAACGSNEASCPEYERTIDRGVYGQAVYKTFQQPDVPLYDIAITASEYSVPVMYRTRSNEEGFYEIELPGTGTYSVCSDFVNVGCHTFGVTTVTRIDLVAEDSASVFWNETDFGECN